jgi:hypothetical protein
VRKRPERSMSRADGNERNLDSRSSDCKYLISE